MAECNHQICILRNHMVGRCMACLMMMCALGLPFVLEQLSTSVMEYHPCFQFLAQRFKIYRVTLAHITPTLVWFCNQRVKDLSSLSHLPSESLKVRYLFGWEVMAVAATRHDRTAGRSGFQHRMSTSGLS